MNVIEHNNKLRIDKLSNEPSFNMTKKELMVIQVISSVVTNKGYDISDDEIDKCIGLVDRIISRLNM